MAATEVGSVFVSNYPPYSQWSEADLERFDAALQATPAADAPPLGMYLHIPFCRKRCRFCYFRVYTDKNADEVQTYCDALAREVEAYAQLPFTQGRPLRFIYFGGGTPSYIAAKHLAELVHRIRDAFPWTDVEEVTFECEPGTLTRPKLENIRELGITRLSLGVEHFNDHILQLNGRAHISTEIDRVIPWVQEIDFAQFNLDLISGMIGETWETWRDTVEKTIDTDPDSVTIYQLELPYNTGISKEFMEGTLDVPLADWQQKREWQLFAIERLEEAGYHVSSAYTMVKGEGSFRYRDSLWHGADMLGTGVSSFGHVGGVHVQNTANWVEYLGAVGEGRLPVQRALQTTETDRLIREFILQMKTGKIQAAYFDKKFDTNVMERFAAPLKALESAGMATLRGDGFDLTMQGLLQVDSLLPGFYDERHRNARYT
ncbi:MAG: radical SAM protein [Acidobacteria bacterium]|nr:radical SAM protein [Acidobacteriota bacterium]